MKWLYRFFAGTLIGLLLFGLFTNWLYDTFKNVPVAGIVFSWLKSAGASIISALQYRVPIWTFLLIVVAIVLLLLFILNFTVQKVPSYVNYTSDKFRNWIWKWSYTESYEVMGLEPYCPDCDVRLITNNIREYDSHWNSSARCSSCNKEWKHPDTIKYVKYGQTPDQAVEFKDEILPLIEKKISDLNK